MFIQPEKHNPCFRCRGLQGVVSSALLLSLMLTATPGHATPPSVSGPPPPISQTGQTQTTQSQNFFTGLSRRQYLLGDLDGLRERLSKYGISLNISETSEVLGNVTGGVKQGAEYDGLTQIQAQLDTQRAFNHYGGTFDASVLQIHGNNLSADNLYTLQTASGIEADRSTRLWELWYDQKFTGDNLLDIKIGQQSLDQEFMVSQSGLVFVNTMFGWPVTPSYDLPGGGPAYPLSALGVRVSDHPTSAVTVLAGVYSGNPAQNNSEDPQKLDSTGTRFPLNGGALAIAEVQYQYPALGSMVYPGHSAPKPGVYKLGAYYDTEEFPDEQFDDNGLSLANPASDGNPRMHRGDYGIYGVADQEVWQSDDDPDRTLNFFTRLLGQPQSDRNLVTFGANVGLVLTDPLHGRDDDNAGIALGYAQVGDGVAALDKASGEFGSLVPVQNGETFIEATYQYQYAPWCQIQPDIQYVFDPGGGVSNPNSPTQRIPNELVLGTRVNLLF